MALKALLFSFAILLAPVFAHAAFVVPELTGPVVDDAHVLEPATAASLETALRYLHDQGGSQIQVLTVPSLEGLEIEQASIQVTDKWKLGGKKNDNGILLMVAPKEHKVRIEVGRGNEGTMTDADSKRIIDQNIVPLFKNGDYNGGILVGVFKIARKTDPGIDLTPYLQGHAHRELTTGHEGRGMPLWLIIVIIILFLLFGGRGLPLFFGGGGFGGGGGGGGSWGGGGGGFSGGGASGDW